MNTNVTKSQLHNHIQYMRGEKQPKENSINYASLTIPMSMSNNIPIFLITKNNLSIIENILTTKNIPMVEIVPLIDDVPTIIGMPIGEDVQIIK